MPSGRGYLQFILDQLSDLEEVDCRPMMGEFILYYRGKIVGGVYDDRLLVRPTKSALARMPDAPRALPYPGARETLLVEDVDDRAFLADLFRAMHDELPPPRPRKKR